MNAVKIKENIYWVGGIDWDLRTFTAALHSAGVPIMKQLESRRQ